MNDDQLDDLKQFITSTVSQQTTDLREDIVKLDTKLTRMIGDVDAKADAILDAVGERLDDHEVRITKLETQTV